MTKFEQGIEEYCKEAGMPEELQPQFKEVVLKLFPDSAHVKSANAALEHKAASRLTSYAVPTAIGGAGGAGLGALLSYLLGSKNIGRNARIGGLVGAVAGAGSEVYDRMKVKKLLARQQKDLEDYIIDRNARMQSDPSTAAPSLEPELSQEESTGYLE